MNDNLTKIFEKIRNEGVVKKEYFPNLNFTEIRNMLEANGIDRHTALQLESVEIALITPFGVLMQIRAYDNDKLGLWGGVIEKNETPIEAAIRELYEETGIEISPEMLESAGIDEHFHKYANGDKAYFKAYRFTARFDYVPKVITDEESVGAVMVAHTILPHQQSFVAECLSSIKKK